MGRHRAAIRFLSQVGLLKVAVALFVTSVAIYIYSWPPESTAWLTQFLYRLQEPIDRPETAPFSYEWRNVTIGLFSTVGVWLGLSGAGDICEARHKRTALLTHADSGILVKGNSAT